MSDTSNELRFDDLTPYLLLKNGNYLYKVPFRDGHAVLKVYYGSRGVLETWAKSFGNVVAEGQTSYMPLTRLRIERECLDLWASHGFRTFGHYDDVKVIAPASQCPPNGYLLLEYVDAPILEDYMPDASVPLEDRLATWRRLMVEWCKRHDLAEREREPMLVHENGDPGHVMLMNDGGPEFLWFDFEMVYRSRRRVKEYIWHEIVQYIWMLLRKTPPELHEQLIAETIEHYPDKARMRAAPDVFLKHPIWYVRLGRSIDARRKKGRKPTSKYGLARRLRAAVSGQ